MADRPTLDGFHPRRPNTRYVGGGMGFNNPEAAEYGAPILKPAQDQSFNKDVFQVPTSALSTEQQGDLNTHRGLTRSEVEDSLRSIDEPEVQEKPRREKKPKKDEVILSE